MAAALVANRVSSGGAIALLLGRKHVIGAQIVIGTFLPSVGTELWDILSFRDRVSSCIYCRLHHLSLFLTARSAPNEHCIIIIFKILIKRTGRNMYALQTCPPRHSSPSDATNTYVYV